MSTSLTPVYPPSDSELFGVFIIVVGIIWSTYLYVHRCKEARRRVKVTVCQQLWRALCLCRRPNLRERAPEEKRS